MPECADCFYLVNGACHRYPPDRTGPNERPLIPDPANTWCGEWRDNTNDWRTANEPPIQSFIDQIVTAIDGIGL